MMRAAVSKSPITHPLAVPSATHVPMLKNALLILPSVLPQRSGPVTSLAETEIVPSRLLTFTLHLLSAWAAAALPQTTTTAVNARRERKLLGFIMNVLRTQSRRCERSPHRSNVGL